MIKLEKIIDGYLPGFGLVRDMEYYYDEDFTDAQMSKIRFKDDVPSQEEGYLMCGGLSGVVELAN